MGGATGVLATKSSYSNVGMKGASLAAAHTQLTAWLIKSDRASAVSGTGVGHQALMRVRSSPLRAQPQSEGVIRRRSSSETARNAALTVHFKVLYVELGEITTRSSVQIHLHATKETKCSSEARSVRPNLEGEM